MIIFNDYAFVKILHFISIGIVLKCGKLLECQNRNTKMIKGLELEPNKKMSRHNLA